LAVLWLVLVFIRFLSAVVSLVSLIFVQNQAVYLVTPRRDFLNRYLLGWKVGSLLHLDAFY